MDKDWLSIPWSIVSYYMSLKDSMKMFSICKYFSYSEYDQLFSLVYAELQLKDINFWKKSQEFKSPVHSIIDRVPLKSYYYEILRIEQIRNGNPNLTANFFYQLWNY